MGRREGCKLPAAAMSLRGTPLVLNLTIFAIGAIVVWIAGARLTKYADAIARVTGISGAFLGALMLGGITSLPELATTVTAASLGNADLAVNNVLGGLTMQVAILAVADVAGSASAISTLVQDRSVRLAAALLIVLLGVSVAGIVIGEPEGWRVGPWGMATLAGGVLAFFFIHRAGARKPLALEEAPRGPLGSRRALVRRTVLAGAAILVAGTALALSGDALGEQSGLGAGYVGLVLVATATSLPELSTTVAAARMGRPDMAFANIFGTNVIDLALVGILDLFWSRGPILEEIGRFSAVAALLAIGVTAVYLVSIVRGRTRSFLRLGVDSIVVLAMYFGGLVLLYRLRDS